MTDELEVVPDIGVRSKTWVDLELRIWEIASLQPHVDALLGFWSGWYQALFSRGLRIFFGRHGLHVVTTDLMLRTVSALVLLVRLDTAVLEVTYH